MVTVIVDLDQIIIPMFQRWIDIFNLTTGESVSIEDFKSWKFEQFLTSPRHKKLFFEILYRPGLYDDIKPVDGAVETLYKLHEAKNKRGKRFRIVIASSPGRGQGPDRGI